VPRETSHRDGLMTTCGCLFGIVCLHKTCWCQSARQNYCNRGFLLSRVVQGGPLAPLLTSISCLFDVKGLDLGGSRLLGTLFTWGCYGTALVCTYWRNPPKVNVFKILVIYKKTNTLSSIICNCVIFHKKFQKIGFQKNFFNRERKRSTTAWGL